jgi:hypothetical protein
MQYFPNLDKNRPQYQTVFLFDRKIDSSFYLKASVCLFFKSACSSWRRRIWSWHKCFLMHLTLMIGIFSFIHIFLIFSPTAVTAAFKISFAGIPFLFEIHCSYITRSITSSCVGRFLEFRSFWEPRIGQTLNFLNFSLPFCTIIPRLKLPTSEETAII